jgi:hypothetical protein
MAHDGRIARYRRCYGRLLRFYPRAYRQRFCESMEQTFHDMCRARADAGGGLLAFSLRVFAETFMAILSENGAVLMTRKRNIVRLAVVVGLLLLIPLVAMQFTAEVQWTFSDFVFAGVMFFGTGLAYELVARRQSSFAYRAGVGVALAAALLLVWINGAVGIIGSEGNPANLLYGAVLGVGLIGAIAARLHASGMMKTLFAMAVVQLLVPVVALFFWAPSFAEPPGMAGVFVLNACFAMMLVAAGLMFRHAARVPA